MIELKTDKTHRTEPHTCSIYVFTFVEMQMFLMRF